MKTLSGNAAEPVGYSAQSCLDAFTEAEDDLSHLVGVTAKCAPVTAAIAVIDGIFYHY